jgi:hypothetical protein
MEGRAVGHNFERDPPRDHPPFFLFLAWRPSWFEIRINGHKFGRGPSKDHSISSNGQNCSILSQNVPKFVLYKHNDELFNMYYRIFYEL